MLIPQMVSVPTDANANIPTDSHQTSTMSYIDTFYSGFDIDAAMAEQRAADAMVEQAHAELAAAEVKLREAQQQVALAQATIAGFRVWQEASGRAAERPPTAPQPVTDTVAISTSDTPATNEGAQGGTASPTARASIFALIDGGAETDEWTIPGLAETLGLGHESHQAIGISVQRLTRSGKIARVRRGVYTKLPSATVAPGAEEGREIRLNGSQEGPG